ncbi:MAG: hypothetical protein SGARI_000818, partial [Bacillariaceae sp.]
GGSRKTRTRNRQLNSRNPLASSRELKSGKGKGSGKGGSSSSAFTTFSGGTCLCSCADPEFTEDRRRLICGPDDDDFFNPVNPGDPLNPVDPVDPVSPFDGPVEPIAPDQIAFIENVMDLNGITCSNLVSYMMDESTKCAAEFNAPQDPTPFAMTLTGQSIIPEDVMTPIGEDIVWQFTPTSPNEELVSMVVSGFPEDTEVTYTVGDGPPTTWKSNGLGNILPIPGTTEADFRAIIDTLEIKSPPESDDLITLTIGVEMETETGTLEYMDFDFPVTVVPSPEAPLLNTNNEILEALENLEGQNQGTPLDFSIDTGDNNDSDSEVLSLVLTVPSDENGPVGKLLANSIPGVVFTDLGDGVYSVNATGSDPSTIQDSLNAFIQSEAILF